MLLSPPETGNPELDSFLVQVVTALGGVFQSASTPIAGGYSPSGNLVQYPLRYVHVKFADDNIGTGMSDSPTGKLYYGLHNSASSVESVTPADYTWVLVSGGGMGTTKNFWYRTIGGAYLDFAIASASPGSLFTIDTGSAIDLNVNVTAQDVIGRVAYAKAATQQLASAPYNVATLGSGSFPATGTWGFAEVWQGTPPVVTGNEILFQIDGVYNASTNTTIWSGPYLAAFKVGQLSAIQANLGSVTAGEATIGSSPEVSGTTMTGSGARIYPDGRFALGNAGTNLVFNGTVAALNGFKVEASGSVGIASLYSGAAVSSYATPSNTGLLTFTASSAKALFVGRFGVSLIVSPASSTLRVYEAYATIEVYDNVAAAVIATIGYLPGGRWLEDTNAGSVVTDNPFAAINTTVDMIVGRSYTVRIAFANASAKTQSTGAAAAIITDVETFGSVQVQQLKI